MSDLSVPEARAKLKEQFVKFGGDKYGEGWADLVSYCSLYSACGSVAAVSAIARPNCTKWNKGDFLPWDRGFPSPALVEVLRERTDVIGKALAEVDGKPQRMKALVPGCGRGVDVCLLESFGYDCVGLEYSQKAVEACEKYAKEHGDTYTVQDDKIGKGSKVFIQGDFYKDDWLENTGLGVKRFDLIYDYTVGIRAQKQANFLTLVCCLVLLRHESSHAT